jgi:hypothetical protein
MLRARFRAVQSSEEEDYLRVALEYGRIVALVGEGAVSYADAQLLQSGVWCLGGVHSPMDRRPDRVTERALYLH